VFCPGCGIEIPSESQYCWMCGKSTTTPASQPEPRESRNSEQAASPAAPKNSLEAEPILHCTDVSKRGPAEIDNSQSLETESPSRSSAFRPVFTIAACVALSSAAATGIFLVPSDRLPHLPAYRGDVPTEMDISDRTALESARDRAVSTIVSAVLNNDTAAVKAVTDQGVDLNALNDLARRLHEGGS